MTFPLHNKNIFQRQNVTKFIFVTFFVFTMNPWHSLWLILSYFSDAALVIIDIAFLFIHKSSNNLKWECYCRSIKHSHLVVDFSVVCQPPAPMSGKYQVFPLPANLRLLCPKKVSDYGVNPPRHPPLHIYNISELFKKQ